ncbi:MAG: hypothetical protein OHK0039_03980 [Bacteroidia bacterium]
MKVLTTLPVVVLTLLLAAACQQERDIPTPAVTPVATAATEKCDQAGTVQKNACGFYIQLDNGNKIFANSSRGFSLSEGARVVVGFSIISSSYNASGSSDSSMGGGTCGSGSSQTPGSASTGNVCMQQSSISEVTLTCIRSESASNDN